MTDRLSFTDLFHSIPARKVIVSVRTLRNAIENALLGHTRSELEVVLADELKLTWVHKDSSPEKESTKRELIRAYTPDWTVPQLVGLARRIVAEHTVHTTELTDLLEEYDRHGGVGSPAKNLIFAANGPKPELVLRDAVNNDIEIVSNAEFCLVFEQPIPADGLSYSRLIAWWRAREGLTDGDDLHVGRVLHQRLAASLGDNPVEQLVFDVYGRRYKQHGFDIPALIPQVYLHYDPYTARTRGSRSKPLARQRMDFLLLFSDRRRVVIEIDGQQHYANSDGTASPTRYAEMVAEDRRLRLAGYEVYRFGGKELMTPDAKDMVATFFDELHQRMR